MSIEKEPEGKYIKAKDPRVFYIRARALSWPFPYRLQY